MVHQDSLEMPATAPHENNGATLSTTAPPESDVIKILIATDVHLGYLENDPVRGGDSFIAFEEVLSHAKQQQADFTLLGGDLFDQAKPSPSCLLRCVDTLRRHCLGSRQIDVQIVSDPNKTLSMGDVNYEDNNINIAHPVISIHGNHDDPVGQGAVSTLDILANARLINYLGRWTDYTQIEIKPLLMRKGATNLALYGLGYLKDQRLSRLFEEGKVKIKRPHGDWFHVFILHQNRADRGNGNYIKEEYLPDFIDLVIWGHEHDSHVHLEFNEEKKFQVTQPGSTVATSLAAGEALPKHCAVLKIHKLDYLFTPIPLQTVRPFIFKTIVLSEEDLGEKSVNENEKVQEFLKSKVYEAIEEAKKLHTDNSSQPLVPLVRLNVFFERDEQDFNRMRFGQNFSGAVANSNDILLMKREKRIREKKEKGEAIEVDMKDAGENAPDVETLLQGYFSALPEDRAPVALSTRAMTEAVRDFTGKRDEDAFRAVMRATRRRALDALMASSATTETEVAEILRTCRLELDGAEPEQLRTLLAVAPDPVPATVPIVKLTKVSAKLGSKMASSLKLSAKSASTTATVILSSDEEMELTQSSRGGRGGRGRGRPKKSPVRSTRRAASTILREPSPPPERRTTPRRSAAKKPSWLQKMIADKDNGIDDDSD